MRAVDTRHGVIYARNALIIEKRDLLLAPMTLTLSTRLSLAGCRPARKNKPDVRLIFTFTNIRRLTIHPVDDYPGEAFSKSSFDEYLDEAGAPLGRFVLSTYDHVFDVSGRCEWADRA